MIVACIVGVGLVAVATGLWVAMPAETRADFSVPQILTLLLMLVAVLGALYGIARTRVTADQDGVTIVNVYRVHRLDWAQIVRVSLRTGDPWVVLDVDDGTTRSVMALQSADGARTRLALRDLRTLVEENTRTPRDD